MTGLREKGAPTSDLIGGGKEGHDGGGRTRSGAPYTISLSLVPERFSSDLRDPCPRIAAEDGRR